MRLRRAVPLLATLAIGAIAIGVIAVAATADRDEGSAHWSDAVADSPASRILTVDADTSAAAGSGCGALRGDPVVRETSTRVTLEVEVVEHPALGLGGTACDLISGVGVVVHLHAPLGGRALVDGTGARRSVLYLDAVSALHGLPAGFTPRGAGWDESRQVLSRWWRNVRYQQTDLTIGPPATLLRRTPTGSGALTHVDIHGARASIRRDAAGPPVSTVDSTVRWNPTADRQVVLEVIDQAPHPLSEDQVLALARGVR